MALIGAVILFFSDLIYSPNDGLYMIFVFIVILGEFIIGSLFLLFNMTSMALIIFLQEDLSIDERIWVEQKLKRNAKIIVIWLVTTFVPFLLFAPNFGFIASVFLLNLVLIFNLATVEENPFLEHRYEL